MRKILAMATCLLLANVALFAQQVTGIIKDGQGKPVNGSTVSLLRAKDSSILKYAVTKEDGRYSFNNTKEGAYLLMATHVGFTPSYSAAFQVAGTDVSMPALELSKPTGDLKGITVTARRQMVEVKADKTILNVEGTVNAVGSDALELLRKSPGVLVDKDDNLSLSGKNGVQVYIDGRPTPLSGKDLSEYLKTMQSAQIDAIEIITNPSAKYDAAGNAGIINIRLKKNKSYGTNGSVNAGYNIGKLPKYNAGVSLNNRSKGINIFGTYNYNKGRNLNYMNLYREVMDSIFDGRNNMQMKNNSHTYKVGMDVTSGKRSTVGLVVNGTVADINFSNQSRTPISYIPTGEVDRILVADNTNKMDRNNTNFNLNYRFVDTSGKELNMDADYGLYRISTNQMQPNTYYDKTGAHEQSRIVYNMIAPTDIDLYSFKTDYEQNYKKGKLGVGGKISYVSTDNDFQRYNVYTSGKTLDTLRSNKFGYKENVNALYVNYNRPFKGFMVQAGLRAENTSSTGRSKGFKYVGSNYETYDSSFNRDYTDVFPSASVTFNKNPMSQIGLSYSRRIDRPAYQDLNPFEFKLDEYTFQKGNTQLRPQYTNSFSVIHTYKYRFTTTLNYSHIKDMFAQLVDVVDGTKGFMTKKNLATQDVVSLNISLPYQYKKFSTFVNLNTNYSQYRANFGTGRTIDLNALAFNAYTQNTLRFGKGFTAELSGFYTSPSVWQGTFKSKAMYSVDGGLQKTILKGKGNIKTSVSDIFHTMKWSGTSTFAGQYLRTNGGWESRQFKINFSYRFGNNQVKAARQRKTGLEDESKRANGGGGGIGQ